MFQMTHPLFQRLDDDEPLRSLAGLGREGAAPLPSDSIFGLSISPLFQAGVAGLAENNPLTTFQTGLASQARQQARAREEAELRQFGIALGKIAHQSGDPAMQQLVALGPDGYLAAVARLNEMAAAQRSGRGAGEIRTGAPRSAESVELSPPNRAPAEPILAADGVQNEDDGLGLVQASFLPDPSPDAHPSINGADAQANNQARPPVDERVVNDPLFGAMTQEQAVQVAEEIAGLPLPHYKRFKVPLFQFARWGAAIDKAGTKRHARRAYMETFAAEGGLDPDDENGAVAGIRPGTLEIVGARLGIAEDTEPVDLTHEQRTQVYREFINLRRNLGRVGGIEVLEQLRDEEVAAVLFDTLFRNGNARGAEAIQRAINSIEPDRVTVDRSFGQETFDAFRNLTDDCSTRQELLDALAVERELQFPLERRRFDHFRFLNSEECK